MQIAVQNWGRCVIRGQPLTSTDPTYETEWREIALDRGPGGSLPLGMACPADHARCGGLLTAAAGLKGCCGMCGAVEDCEGVFRVVGACEAYGGL